MINFHYYHYYYCYHYDSFVGGTRFFLSLEDDIFKIFGADKMSGIYDTLKFDRSILSRLFSIFNIYVVSRFLHFILICFREDHNV